MTETSSPPPTLADLARLLGSVNLEDVAISAAIDAQGRLYPVNGLTDKLGAALERQQRTGLLHGVLVANDQHDGNPLKPGPSTVPLQLLRAGTLHEAAEKLAAESQPRHIIAGEIRDTFRLFGVPDPVPFKQYYQHLAVLKPVDREKLPRAAVAGLAENAYAPLREASIRQWDEAVARESAGYEGESLEAAVLDQIGNERTASRWMIIGPPGSGKTTLLEYIAWRCTTQDEAPGTTKRRLLPVYVRLRHWQEWSEAGHGYDLVDFLTHAFTRDGAGPSPTQWQLWLQLGLVLLLLDGLDEVDRAGDFEHKGLWAFLDHAPYRTSPVIITGRAVSIEQYRDLGLNLKVLKLDELAQRQQNAFVRSYPARHPDAFDAEGLLSQLRRTPGIRHLATNPLFLSITCLLMDGPTSAALPETRSELLGGAMRKLLERGEKRGIETQGDAPTLSQSHSRNPSSKAPPIHIRLSVDDKLIVLEELALELWMRGGSHGQLSADGRNVHELLRRLARRRGYSSPASVASGLLKDLTRGSGLLRQVPNGHYAFLHLTLHEYLVAAALSRRLAIDGWPRARIRDAENRSIAVTRLIREKAWFPEWREVIIMLAGSLRDASPLVELLLVEPCDAFHDMALLAARCLGEAVPARIEQGLARRVIEDCLALLHSASKRDRKSAFAVLERVRHPLVLEYLKGLLENNDLNLALDAARTIGRIGDEKAVPSLLKTLSAHKSEWIRAEAADALGRFGSHPEAIEGLLSALNDADSLVWRHAAEALGHSDNPELAQRLLEIWLAGLGNDQTIAAGIALELMPLDSVLDKIISVLLDSSPPATAREYAARLLGKSDGAKAAKALLLGLEDTSAEVRQASAWALSHIRMPFAAERLLDTLNDPDLEVGEAARWSLTILKPRLDPRTISDLRASPNPLARSVAVSNLEGTDQSELIASLQMALEDFDWRVRQEAAWCLASLRTPAATDALLSTLRAPRFQNLPFVMTHRANAWGDRFTSGSYFGPTNPKPTAFQGLKKEFVSRKISARTRRMAIRVLAAIAPDWFILPLLQHLETTDDQLAEETIAALKAVVDADAVDGLLSVMSDRPRMSKQAVQALRRMLDLPSIYIEFDLPPAPPFPPTTFREFLVERLADTGDPSLAPSLEALLADDDIGVRAKAARTLGTLRASSATSSLLWLLSDSAIPVRIAAAEALGNLGEADAVEGLVWALSDEAGTVCEKAAEALIGINQPSAVSHLLELLAPQIQVTPRTGMRESSQAQRMVGLHLLNRLACQWPALEARAPQETYIYDLVCDLYHATASIGYSEQEQRRRWFSGLSDCTLSLGLSQRPEWAGRAETLLRRLVQEVPSFSAARQRLVDLLTRWPGRQADAVLAARELVGLYPEEDTSWELLACALYVRGDFEGALEAYKRAAERAVDSEGRGRATRNCAYCCLEKGWGDEATEFYLQATPMERVEPLARLLEAELHLAAFDPSTAERVAEELSTRDQCRVSATFIVAFAQLASGNLTKVLTSFRTAMEAANSWISIDGALRDLDRYTRQYGDLPCVNEIRALLLARHKQLAAMWPEPTVAA